MSVLIVDDSPQESCMLAHLLLRGGFKDLTIAKTATQAFGYLGMNDPSRPCPVDLIFMDMVMQQVNGIEVCIMIKAAEHLRDIPIVMVAEPSEIENVEVALAHVERAFAAGAIDYVIRPVKEKELIARARSLLRLKTEIDKRKARERQLVELSNQLKEANEKLERLSITDGLTGIANRRLFDRRLGQEFRRMKRDQKPLSLVLCDVDYFKLYNDTYGHMAGDSCLQAIARAIDHSARRAADLPARYGGEEFALVLPDTNPDGAAAVAEKLRKSVEDLNMPHSTSLVKECVTLSSGVATAFPYHDSSPEEIISLADKALYLAKKKGRNQVQSEVLSRE